MNPSPEYYDEPFSEEFKTDPIYRRTIGDSTVEVYEPFNGIGYIRAEVAKSTKIASIGKFTMSVFEELKRVGIVELICNVKINFENGHSFVKHFGFEEYDRSDKLVYYRRYI